jgi:uncharacterized protein
MSQINYILKYFTVWLDGHGLMAEGHECKLPHPQIKFEDMRAGGMDSPHPVDLGVEKMEVDFKLYSFNPLIIRRWGLLNGQSSRLTFRGHMEGTGGQNDKIKAVMDAHPDKMDFGNWKPGSHPENSWHAKVSYYRLEINDVVEIEIDPLGFKRIIGGVDQLTNARISLGI